MDKFSLIATLLIATPALAADAPTPPSPSIDSAVAQQLGSLTLYNTQCRLQLAQTNTALNDLKKKCGSLCEAKPDSSPTVTPMPVTPQDGKK